MLQSDLYDYSDAYIFLRGTYGVTDLNNAADDKKNSY